MKEQNLTELMFCAYNQGYKSLWSQVFHNRMFDLETYNILTEIAQTY